MELWFAALLGAVQGLTEFLPVSSTAHLAIVPALLGREDPGAAYTAVIQLGTLAAVIGFFARDLWRMALHDRRAAALVVLGTVPIGIAGLALKDYITGPWRSLEVIAAALIVVGAIMWAADRRSAQGRGLEAVGWRDALLIGLAQACALVPGVSRSGATITAALLLGFRRDGAARFSFLLSIPAIGAAGLFEMKDAVNELGGDAVPSLLVGSLVAAVVGYASIAWLLKHLATRSVVPFSLYRIALGLALLAWGTVGLVR